MGKIPGAAAVSNFFCAPKIVRRSPAELTSRAEKAILDSRSENSDDTSLKGHDYDAAISTVGMDCSAKHLYAQKSGAWSDKYPRLAKDPPENEQTSRYALIVRSRESKDTRKKLELHSIVVQSPLLKQALGKIFEGYPGITTDVDRLEFREPFEPFVHRWQRFEQATVNERHLETKQHLALLWDVLEVELRDLLQKIRDHRRHGVCEYPTLWTLFEPESLVIGRQYDREHLYRCVKGSKNTGTYNVEVQYVDWDGERFGFASAMVPILQFAGTKPLASLPVSPLSQSEDKAAIEKRAMARGKTFEALRGYHFKAYNGVAREATGTKLARYNVQSRIIIDTAAFNLFNPSHQVKVTTFDAPKPIAPNPVDDGSLCSVVEMPEPQAASTLPPPPEYQKSPFAEIKALTKSQLLICCNSVRAYSLKDKKWLSMYMDSLEEIVWDDGAFPSLVMPANTKDLVLAFAESQVKRQQNFDDFIHGKGKGTIMLLSGPPGTGKTLTAESVAEVMRTPLYLLSAGDLGTDPKEVEKTLTTTLAMTAKWKAVLLLDEADVFLLARNAHDLERNKLVSIFLRILEYYEGFLFLTTNRVEDIDAAFESRIQLSLKYTELDADCRYQVWKGFLKTCQLAEGEFTEERLRLLAQTKLNGRQIKNVIKPAQLLAASKDSKMTFEHVDVVMKLKAANTFGRKEVPMITMAQ